ncbi:MAG: hypothetical protein IV100_13920 [Myxococcales bacterium]|nr:hypothetical protein [Myxococcales bacterium]
MRTWCLALIPMLTTACGAEPERGASVSAPEDVTADVIGDVEIASGPDDVAWEDVAEVADAHPIDVPEPPGLCDEDRTATNVASLRALGLDSAVSVVGGTIGAPFERGPGDWYAPFTVETVHYGWTFVVGASVNVPIPRGFVVEPGARIVVGLSQSHPGIWDVGETPYWSNVTAMIPLADVPAEALEWTRHRAPLVAVVKITAIDAQRATFEVVSPLVGDFPAITFQDNWYAEWGITYPSPNDDFLYLASLTGLTAYPSDSGGSTYLGSILDFRPVVEELVDAVRAPEPGELDALRAERDRLHLAWRLHRAETVVTGRVTGLASECCTGAGGTYVRYDRTEVLAGDVPSSFVLGGHGYYGPEACDDEYIVAPLAFSDGPQVAEPFTCDAFDGPDSMSNIGTQLAATPETVAEVKAWIAGAPPLLQLYPEGQGDPGDPPPASLPWSTVRDAAAAFSLATHIALMTVVKVETLEGGHRVTLETTWSAYEYEHLKRHRVSAAFACGDERLLELGARWLAPVVLLDPAFEGSPNPENAFLIPGVLAPEWAIPDQLRNTLELRLNL